MDRIKKGELTVEYCPTGDMTSDFFTKPLQGTPFRRHRDDILNRKPEVGPASLQVQDHRSVLEDVQTARTRERLPVGRTDGHTKSWA